MKAKTSRLSGRALDCAVALAEGATNLHFDTVANWWFTLNGEDRVLSTGWSASQNYSPSTMWEHGGPIIERMANGHFFFMENDGDNCHVAFSNTRHDNAHGYGTPLLVAAMRCYVFSKLGDEVDIPKELLE